MNEKRNGTTRKERAVRILLNSPFRIDRHSFSDIMGYMVALQQHVNYYNLENKKEGNWKQLLEDDSIIRMVMIINEPLDRLDKKISTYKANKNSYHDNLNAIRLLIEWYDIIEAWCEKLSELGEKQLASTIQGMLDDVLVNSKKNIQDYHLKLTEEHKQKRKTKKLKSPPPPDTGTSGKSGPEEIEKALHTFKKIITHIQNITRKQLHNSLFDNNNHSPDKALYIAFALLYKQLQSHLNTLSKKHLDFYYQDILAQQIDAGRSQKAIVCFKLIPGLKNTLVRKGSNLSAGKLFGSKNDVVFRTEKPLVVYPVELTEMQVLHFNVNPHIRIGTDKPLISAAQKQDYMIKGKELVPARRRFAFGAGKETSNTTEINSSTNADIGFVVSSPVLLLTEGKRTILLQINFSKGPASDHFSMLLEQVQNNRGITPDTAFSYVFDDSFNISYTSKKGWVDTSHAKFSFDKKNNRFCIEIDLDINTPPLTASDKITEELKWPSVKVQLSNTSPVYVYSFFKGINLDSVAIDVKAERLRNLSLYNNVGKIAAGKSFDLFGPLASAKSSYLLFGKSELFRKNLKKIDLHLEWENIPSDYGGFESYYEGYPVDIGNDTFKVSYSVLNNSYWIPLGEQGQNIPLFSDSSCLSPEGYKSVKLDTSRSMQLDKLEQANIPQDHQLGDPLKYNVETRTGFFKMELTAPRHSFGFDEYQKAYSEIAAFNAKNKEQLPYPNKPYIPKVKEISVDYNASHIVSFNDNISVNTNDVGELYHLTPFGLKKAVDNKRVYERCLFPEFDAKGNLYLGLKGLRETTTLSVYFDFKRSGVANKLRSDKINWHYYFEKEWWKIKDKNIISDQTEGFIKSGIIELTLPVFETHNSGQDDTPYWIRISTDENTGYYPVIQGIYINALETVYAGTDPAIIGKEVPAGSIDKFLNEESNIKEVFQPGPSEGGACPESEKQFYTRVSERLRHKDRAITAWDYEHLILERFQEVQAVKCTNLNASFQPVPQRVRVIVLNKEWTAGKKAYFNEAALHRMKAFLKKQSSAFVDITVMNPTPEYLLVNCMVRFMPHKEGGYYWSKLNNDISDFLSPVSNTKNNTGSIGGKIIPTTVVSFIENLPYIKSVEKLRIEHIVRLDNDKYTLGVYKGGDPINVSKPWSILTPAKKHKIVNADKKHGSFREVGIGNMKISQDMILGEEHKNREYRTAPEQHKKTAPDNDSIFVFNKKTREK